MEQIFDLEVSADRPILRLDDLFPGCTALIDTGALFPVWTKSRQHNQNKNGPSSPTAGEVRFYMYF